MTSDNEKREKRNARVDGWALIAIAVLYVTPSIPLVIGFLSARIQQDFSTEVKR